MGESQGSWTVCYLVELRSTRASEPPGTRSLKRRRDVNDRPAAISQRKAQVVIVDNKADASKNLVVTGGWGWFGSAEARSVA